jgi:hypothetical protein
MEGMGELQSFMVTKWFCRRDARRKRLVEEKALPLLKGAPVMQQFWTLTVIPVYSLKRKSLWTWMGMLVGKPVARLRSSAKL